MKNIVCCIPKIYIHVIMITGSQEPVEKSLNVCPLLSTYYLFLALNELKCCLRKSGSAE